MSSIDSLLYIARAYAAAEQIDLSTVSWRALGDSKKLTAIEGGADIQVRRFEKTMQWFSENWPANAVWPDEVARPERLTPPVGDEAQADEAPEGGAGGQILGDGQLHTAPAAQRLPSIERAKS